MNKKFITTVYFCKQSATVQVRLPQYFETHHHVTINVFFLIYVHWMNWIKYDNKAVHFVPIQRHEVNRIFEIMKIDVRFLLITVKK